jgi:hypothetical protein
MRPADIAKAFPEVWRVKREGGAFRLSQIYDSRFAGTELLETRLTILESAVDEAIASHAKG